MLLCPSMEIEKKKKRERKETPSIKQVKGTQYKEYFGMLM